MEWLQNPYVAGALAGVMTAAYVDLAAFRKWQSWKEAREYSWSLASWRWFQGAIVGVLTALGIGVLT